ncbi:MAG: response regulator transcription factor [Candidatus Onthovivens sp.]|nr:response regulator transcription factor [Candidatus Onthovivens sp.]
MNNYLIYSIEDDEDISYIIKATLEKQGYKVKSFSDGESFLDAFKIEKPNLILLDMMLPKIQGKDLLRYLRNDPNNDDIQIIIVSANKLTIDKIDGLDLGADDYIAKPFDLLELISRVNAKARRFLNQKKSVAFKDFVINFDNKTLTKNSVFIDLTNSEFKVFALLVKNRNRVVSKKEIAVELYNDENKENNRTITMLIKSIRKKIDDKDQTIINSRYGIGYIINE